MKENQKTIKQLPFWDNAIFWILVGLIFLVPIVMTRYTIACFEPIKLLVLKTGAILIIACWIAKIVQEKKIQLVYTFLWLPLTLFLVVTSLATLLSIQPHTSIYGELYRNEGLLTIGIYFLLFYATINFVQQKRQLNILLATVIVSSTVVAIYGVLQHFGWDLISWDPTIMPVDRSFSTFGNPVFLGGFLCLVIPVVLMMLFRKQSLASRVALSGSALLLISCLVFTNTRAAVLGLIASVVLVLALAWRLLWQRKLILAVVGVTLLLGGLTTLSSPRQRFAQGPSSGFTQRVAEVAQLEKGTVGSRLFVWKTSLSAIAAKPALGFGPDTFRHVYLRYRPRSWFKTLAEKVPFDKAHNEFIQIATSQGLLGILAFCWLIVAFFWQTIFKISSLEKEATEERALLLVGIVAGVVAYLAQIQFSFSVFSYTFLFWIMPGLGSLLTYSKRQQLPQVEINLAKQPEPKAWQSAVYTCVLVAAVISIYFAVLPLVAELHIRRGTTKLRDNLNREAAEEFSQAVKLNPSEVRYWVYLAYAYSQESLSSQGQLNYQIYNQAIDAFNHAEQANPLEEDTFFFRANLNLNIGETLSNPKFFDLVIADLNQLLRRNPYDPETHYSLGLAYADKKMYDQAIKNWQIAISIDSKMSGAYYNIARAYQLKGNLKEARKYYQKAIDLNPDDTNTRKALEELK